MAPVLYNTIWMKPGLKCDDLLYYRKQGLES